MSARDLRSYFVPATLALVAVGGVSAASLASSAGLSGSSRAARATHWTGKTKVGSRFVFRVSGTWVRGVHTQVISSCNDRIDVGAAPGQVRRGDKFTLPLVDTSYHSASGWISGTIKGRRAHGRIFANYMEQVSQPGTSPNGTPNPPRTIGCVLDTTWTAKR